MKQAVGQDSLYQLSSAVFHLGFELYDLHLQVIIFIFDLCELFLGILKLDLCGDQLVFQIIHFFVFQFDIIFKGISLLFCLKIVIRNIQGEKYIPGVSALFSVSLAVGAFRYLVIQIGRYCLQVFFAFKSAESIYLYPDQYFCKMFC